MASLEYRLNKFLSAALVMLEGVSPYIDELSFGQFLHFLAVSLKPGSVVAYDYKIRNTADDFELGSTTKRVFRLPAAKNDVITYHGSLGFKVEHLELSSELLSRLLPNLANSHTPLFAEDGLLKLAVPSQNDL